MAGSLIARQAHTRTSRAFAGMRTPLSSTQFIACPRRSPASALCSRYQSGEVDWSGRISRCGDEMMRVMLYEAAQSMVRSKKWCWLKAWAMQIARRRGMKKAIVALARRLAVILHRIWVDGTEFRWTREPAAAAA